MRLAITILLGLALLAVGLVLGGLKPRREIAELRAEIEKLEGDVKKADERASTRRRVSFLPLPGLERLSESEGRAQEANEDDSDRRQPQRRPRARWWRGYQPERDRLGDASIDDDVRPRTPEERMRRFDTMADAQKIRADQSRQALREQARLDDKQMQMVDEVIGTMNDKLAPHADVLLGIVDSNMDPDPTELLFISKEVTAILYDGQAKLEESVGPGSMREVGQEARQVWNYVDLEMFRPAAERIAERRAREGPSGGANR